MITTQVEQPISVHTNLVPIDTRIMAMDETAMASITDSMVNLYTDKTMAVIREYATNARDGMRAAGKDGAITIQLPSMFDSQLVISDSGIGMTLDEVLNRYSQYGASDKRDTNDQAGAFGFGCKVGFAISNQFVVTSIKDGMRTVALFARNEKRIGTASILSHNAVDFPDGTTVAVAVEDIDRMHEAVRRFVWGWRASDYILENAPENMSFTSVFDESVRIGPVIWAENPTRVPLSTYNNHNRYAPNPHGVLVLMGGVLYPLGQNIEASTGWDRVKAAGGQFIINADIGDVEIVPSREGVRDSEKTIEFLESAFGSFLHALTSKYERDITEQKSLYEAALYVGKSQRLLSALNLIDHFLWHGNRILSTAKIELESFHYDASKDRFSKHNGPYTFVLFSRDTLYPKDKSERSIGKTLVITHIPEDESPARVRTRMKGYCQEQNYERVLLAPDENFQFGWFDKDFPGLRVMTYVDYLVARKPAKVDHEPGWAKVRYDVHGINEDGILDKAYFGTLKTLAELREMKTVYYYEINEDKHMALPQRTNSFIEGGFPLDAVIIGLTKGRSVETLRKRLPHAVDLQDVVAGEIQRRLKKFTKADLRYLRIRESGSNASSYEAVRMAKMLLPKIRSITNPFAVRIIKALTKEEISTREEWVSGQHHEMVNAPWAKSIQTEAWVSYQQRIIFESRQAPTLIDHFPLLRHQLSYTTDTYFIQHVIEYINTAVPVNADESILAA